MTKERTVLHWHRMTDSFGRPQWRAYHGGRGYYLTQLDQKWWLAVQGIKSLDEPGPRRQEEWYETADQEEWYETADEGKQAALEYENAKLVAHRILREESK
jgi:hypothetical protein